MRTIIELDPEELEKIYKEVLELRRKRGFSYNKIREIIQKKYKVKISKATVLRWINNKTNPFNKIRLIEIKPSPELSYIIGAFLGDGNAYLEEKMYAYRIKLKVKDKEFAEEFKRCLEKLGLKPKYYFEENKTRTNRWVVEVKNKQLYFFLKETFRRTNRNC